MTVRGANGGLDANWMNRHGIPTVTSARAKNEVHTTDEWIDLNEYDRACALALQLATVR
jgi:tripeptide aminopeptidase